MGVKHWKCFILLTDENDIDIIIDIHSCSNYVGWPAGHLDAKPLVQMLTAKVTSTPVKSIHVLLAATLVALPPDAASEEADIVQRCAGPQ